MFLFLSKFLPNWIYPLGLALIILFTSFLLKGKNRWQTRLTLAAIVVLWLGGNDSVSRALAKSLEWQNLPNGTLPPADAIVVLGGGTEPADYPRPMVELNSAGDRVIYGAMLFKQGKAPWILLSGGAITWQGSRQTTPAEEMAEVIQLLEIPPDSIRVQNQSLNTYEEAQMDAVILRNAGAGHILLVTSAMHMPRAKRLFEKQGFKITAAPTDFKVTANDQATKVEWQSVILNFVPTVSNLSLTSAAIKEYLGLWVYQLRGWI